MSDSDKMLAEFEAYLKKKEMSWLGKFKAMARQFFVAAYAAGQKAQQAEVERLRAELDETKRWLDERSEAYGKTCSMVDQLQTELAAARNQSRNDADAITEQALRVLDSSEVDGDSDSVPPTVPELVELMADAAVMAREERNLWHSAAQRLKDELAAAKAEIESVIRLGPHPVEQVQMPLATFVRSRFVWRWDYDLVVEKLEKAQDELAAAKAASVVPVKVLNIFEGTYESDRYIELRTDAEADTFTDWLRERMKDNTPPQA